MAGVKGESNPSLHIHIHYMYIYTGRKPAKDSVSKATPGAPSLLYLGEQPEAVTKSLMDGY